MSIENMGITRASKVLDDLVNFMIENNVEDEHTKIVLCTAMKTVLQYIVDKEKQTEILNLIRINTIAKDNSYEFKITSEDENYESIKEWREDDK